MQITSNLKPTQSPTPINVHTRAARYQQNMQYRIMLLNTEMTIGVTIVKQMLHYTRSVFVWFRFKLQQTFFHHRLPSCQRKLDWTILLLTWFEISGFALANTSLFLNSSHRSLWRLSVYPLEVATSVHHELHNNFICNTSSLMYPE